MQNLENRKPVLNNCIECSHNHLLFLSPLCQRAFEGSISVFWLLCSPCKIHGDFVLLLPWLQTQFVEGSWGPVCFPSYTASLSFDLGRSPSQYKWKIRFVFPFLFPWFSCNGSLKESLKGDSGKHFSSSCLILYIWTTSAIFLFLLDNSSEKLKNYLFMIITFLSAF